MGKCLTCGRIINPIQMLKIKRNVVSVGEKKDYKLKQIKEENQRIIIWRCQNK